MRRIISVLTWILLTFSLAAYIGSSMDSAPDTVSSVTRKGRSNAEVHSQETAPISAPSPSH